MKENEMGETCSPHIGEMRNAYTILVGKHEWERPKIDRRMKWISKKWNVRVWIAFNSLRIVSTGGLLWTR
jgi:hypothetical protein